MEVRAREAVILAEDFGRLVDFYRDVLDFQVIKLFEDGFHYCNLESKTGIKLAIASASERQVKPGDRAHNTVVLQFEVDDVKAFLSHVAENGGSVTAEPSFNQADNFWFGGFADPEGNSFWIVDANCP